MKKVMIALSVIAMTVCAQAATIKWSSGTASNSFYGPDGNSMYGVAGYTMTVYFYTDSLGQNEIVAAKQSITEANKFGAFAGTGGDNFTASTSDVTSTYYAKAIITDGVHTRETGIEAFNVPASGSPTINFATGTNFASTGNKWGEWQTAAVPEPTSGLLLLLGMAGLALRRKQA